MSGELYYPQSNSATAHAAVSFQVCQLTEHDAILHHLESDRLYAAYAIGDLRPGLFEKCQWYMAQCGRRLDSESESRALCLRYGGRQPNILFAMGHERGVFEILRRHLRPWLASFSFQPHHLETIKSLYRIGREEMMIRMHLTADRFVPPSSAASRLTPNHYRELNKLYRWGSGMFFSPHNIQEGVYHGVWCEGRLVSVAGTHVNEPRYGIAAVGNVFTHPDYRNRGFATACTAAVSAELVKTCSDVVLNVSASNDPAIRVYTKLGYNEHCRFIEAIGTRRSNWLTEGFLRWFIDKISNI